MIILSHILGTAFHLLLHEGLSARKSVIPGLQFPQNSIDGGILHISAKSALHVQLSILLIQSTFEQVIAHALNDFVLELSDVRDVKNLHH